MQLTTVYFIRHAESDYSVRDEVARPLTQKGLADCRFVTEFLSDKSINAVLSSPFRRAVDTVSDFAQRNKLKTEIIENFKEHKWGDEWLSQPDFFTLIERQWADFDYKLYGGESLSEVQIRNIAALRQALAKYNGKNIAIGTHATALSTIINYYDNTYGYKDFMAIVDLMPWAVKMSFDGENCREIEKINLFVKRKVFLKHV
ncbi:MAG: histidine phosphatase family protein [Oscillospiraceae bacterium]|nr:histidine phosphatase family protein [Oscillospiraceae bacterium]